MGNGVINIRVDKGLKKESEAIFNDVNRNHHNEKIVCIIDDNVNKQNRLIDNVEIVGGRESIVNESDNYNEGRISQYYSINL